MNEQFLKQKKESEAIQERVAKVREDQRVKEKEKGEREMRESREKEVRKVLQQDREICEEAVQPKGKEWSWRDGQEPDSAQFCEHSAVATSSAVRMLQEALSWRVGGELEEGLRFALKRRAWMQQAIVAKLNQLQTEEHEKKMAAKVKRPEPQPVSSGESEDEDVKGPRGYIVEGMQKREREVAAEREIRYQFRKLVDAGLTGEESVEMETKLYKLAKLCGVKHSSYAIATKPREKVKWETPRGKDLTDVRNRQELRVCKGTWIEVCCEEGSHLSTEAGWDSWATARITEQNNVTSPITMDEMAAVIIGTLEIEGREVYIHHSFPCTSVCKWSTFNIRQGGAMRQRIEEARLRLGIMIGEYVEWLEGVVRGFSEEQRQRARGS